MKDTAIYDFVNQQHQPQQHQQWNHQQQHQLHRQLQQQTHASSVYSNQSSANNNDHHHHNNQHQHGQQLQQQQRSIIGQQSQHLSQYHNHNQQQYLPATHHNNSAYYQQQQHQASGATNTHIYPSYQQQQNSNLQHGAPNMTASISSTSTNVSIPGEQHHLPNNTQQQQTNITSNWSSAPGGATAASTGAGVVAPSLVTQQSHHLVLNEHSQASGYLTHTGYHNNTNTGEQIRNHSNVPVSSTANGIHQDNNSTNSYGAINASHLYSGISMGPPNTETYGYNNYNAAFFQASPNNNGSHNPQSVGHLSPTNISTFWNQQQTTLSGNQVNSIPQRPITTTEQTSAVATGNYVDPRIYYDRSTAAVATTAYNQNVQNYLQQPQVQQTDILHQRITQPNDTSTVQQNDTQQTSDQILNNPQQQQSNSANNPSQSNSDGRIQFTSNQQQQQTFNSTSNHTYNNYSTKVVYDKQMVVAPQTNQSNTQQSQLLSNDNTRNIPQHNSKQTSSSNKIVNSKETIRPVDPIMKQSNQQNADDKENSKSNSQEALLPISEERADVAIAKSNNRQNLQRNSSEPIEKSSSFVINTNSRLRGNNNRPLTQQTGIDPKDVIQDKPSYQYQHRKPQQHASATNQENNVRDIGKELFENKTVNKFLSNNTSVGHEEKSVKSDSTRVDSNSTKQHSPRDKQSLEDSMASISLSTSPRKTTWASIASQPAKISQPKSLKSKIAGSNSVLSNSAKHHLAAAAAAVSSLEPSISSSSLELKNSINPAIKSSVSAATTSIQVRNSMPPPSSRLPSVAASLKLDLLGKESIETSKISWPAVNASIDLSLDDEVSKKSKNTQNESNNNNIGRIQNSQTNSPSNSDKNNNNNNDDNYRTPHRDNSNSYQHNQRKQYQGSTQMNRDLPWSQRNEQRDYYNRDRREFESRGNNLSDNSRDVNNGFNNNMRNREDESNNYKNNDSRPNQRNHHNKERPNEPPGIRDQGPVVIKHYPDHPQYNRNGFRGNNSYYNNHHIRPSNNNNNSNDNDDNNHKHAYNNHFNDKNHHNLRSTHNRMVDNSTRHHNDKNVIPNGKEDEQSINAPPNQLDSKKFKNPETFDLDTEDARYFIIKSYSEDDIHRSIKYSIWTSTNHGNEKLDQAYRQQKQKSKDAPVYLFFSVNASGHFCGMAQMMSKVDFNSSSGVWAQSKWQGEFKVKWIYVKDIPNNALRHVTLENNEDKPVTNSRDTQEVPSEKGKAVLKIIHEYQHTTSLFDDFLHYERRQEEERYKRNNAQFEQPQQYNIQNRNDHRDFASRPPAPIGNNNFRPYPKPPTHRGGGHFQNNNNNNYGRDQSNRYMHVVD